MDSQPANSQTSALVQEWLASLSDTERKLQFLAADLLKTSYFPEKTHGFKRWKQTRGGK